MRRTQKCGVVVLVLALALLVGCAEDTGSSVPFTLDVSPEFVQGAIPGATSGVLVTIDNESKTDESVTITASANGAQVSVNPGEIREGEVAEVTVIPDAATEERSLEIVVTGTRGDLEQTATRSTTVFAWEDDRGEYAGTLLSLFTTWLAERQPDLGISVSTQFSGSFIAPGLLVVSHYEYMSDDWELGLSWHVMIPPDDWAEIYLRPREELVPTLAFRLSSQNAALQDGVVAIEAVAPPTEVVR